MGDDIYENRCTPICRCDNEFCGMKAVLCPVCKHNVFHRKMTEIVVCRVWIDEDGYHDDVTSDLSSPSYDFKCAKCGHEGLEGKA